MHGEFQAQSNCQAHFRWIIPGSPTGEDFADDGHPSCFGGSLVLCWWEAAVYFVRRSVAVLAGRKTPVYEAGIVNMT
jgi:hypothetical protein